VSIADPTRYHISLAYATEGNIRLLISPSLTTAPSLFIHGHGAAFKPSINGTNPMFDTTLPLMLRDVTLSGNVAPISAHGGAALVLDHVTVHDSQRLIVGGPFTATNLSIYNNTDATAAIVATGGYDITIDRATITGGHSVLSVASAAHVHLKNLMVTGTSERAFDLVGHPGELESSTIAFAGRFAQSAPCSVACSASLHVTGTIIWEPVCVDETANDAAGPCTYSSSIVSNATPPPGTTNTDPLFVNPGAEDFHIQPTSPARDAMDTGPDRDFEGDPRPGGPKFDIGADEIP
jgi:hypothetical protein